MKKRPQARASQDLRLKENLRLLKVDSGAGSEYYMAESILGSIREGEGGQEDDSSSSSVVGQGLGSDG